MTLAVAIVGMVAGLLFVWVIEKHMADDLDADAEIKVLRASNASLAPLPQSRPSPVGIATVCAPVPWIADRADEDPWRARCLPSADLRNR